MSTVNFILPKKEEEMIILELGTSQYHSNEKKEAISRTRIHSFFNEETDWKFRDIFQQENDIDGEIEVFESFGNSNPQTTAKFIKVQLKSTDDQDIDVINQQIIYDAKPKFVRFCYLCDQPIILIIHDIPKNVSYYVWMQKYIYEVLEKNNPDWKNNTSSVRLRFGISNVLCKENIPDLKKIALHGTKEIMRMRENSSYEEHRQKVQQVVKKGGIYFANFQTSKGTAIRPVYVAGILNHKKVFVAPITTNLSFKNSPMYVLLTNEELPILQYPTLILIDSITIIDKYDLLDFLGQVPQDIYETASRIIKNIF